MNAREVIATNDGPKAIGLVFLSGQIPLPDRRASFASQKQGREPFRQVQGRIWGTTFKLEPVETPALDARIEVEAALATVGPQRIRGFQERPRRVQPANAVSVWRFPPIW